ncbi:HEPN domain-containing protein [Candidatus Woesearchaeota archaeon]|nr:HEPN domain-containing protein [Candidatus Woesearchaeota archaeon]
MKLDELFEKRLLRKIPKDALKSKKSLEISKKYLEDSKKLVTTGGFNFVILAAYTSMFHAARAILYRDGIQEKSHFAVFAYLKEKYLTQIGNELLFEFNNAREQRHEGLYGLEYEFKEEDVKHIIELAEKFYKKIKTLLS